MQFSVQSWTVISWQKTRMYYCAEKKSYVLNLDFLNKILSFGLMYAAQ